MYVYIWYIYVYYICIYIHIYISLRIRTEYGEILYNLFCIKYKCGKIRTRKTPNTDTFYAVKD